MNKAYKYRIYPSNEQTIIMSKTFGCVRFVYNEILTVQQNKYKNGEKHMSKIDANNYCNQILKKEYPFLCEVDKFAITNSIFALENAYKKFFLRKGRIPKYKSKHKSKMSYTTNITGRNIEIGINFIKLPKIGIVKAKIHRVAPKGYKLKSVTVSMERDGSYYASVLYEYKDKETICFNDTNKIVGLDYKSDGLFVSSDKEICGMPHYFRNKQPKLAKEQRRLKNKTIGSKNWKKQQRKIAVIYRNIANQRKDFLHKKSTEIANRYNIVCVENLNMTSMANKHFGNGKSTLDNGYGMFISMLEYKLHDRGGKLVKIGRWFPSSQICHQCGMIHAEMKNLSIRIMNCICGCRCDRDYNAAINIKKEGISKIFN